MRSLFGSAVQLVGRNPEQKAINQLALDVSSASERLQTQIDRKLPQVYYEQNDNGSTVSDGDSFGSLNCPALKAGKGYLITVSFVASANDVFVFTLKDRDISLFTQTAVKSDDADNNIYCSMQYIDSPKAQARYKIHVNSTGGGSLTDLTYTITALLCETKEV